MKIHKSEKEKMLAGEIYDCGDDELIKRWHKAKKLQKKYNQISSKNLQKRDELLNELLDAKGENVWITAPFFADYGDNIYIGDNVEINTNCVFLDCNVIKIGKNSGIGPGVQLYTVSHPLKAKERVSNKSTFWKSQSKPIIIGENVWIGGGTIILPGVGIGDNTTIGAGSVVTTSIASNKLAVGNPCKVIREL